MDKQKAAAMRTMLELYFKDATFAKTLKDAGLSISVGRGTFTPTEITFKVTLAETDSNGNAQTREAEALKRKYPHLVDKRIRVTTKRGSVLGTIVEFHSRKPKYPFIVEGADGKRYKVPSFIAEGPAAE